MSDKLLTLLKDSQHIKCWYPCSGDDFEIIRLWRSGLGNEIIPNLFILTDPNLKTIQDFYNTEDRLKKDGFELIENIEINSRLSSIQEIEWEYSNINWEAITTEKKKEALEFLDTNIGEIVELIDMGIEIFEPSKFDNLAINEKLNLINIIDNQPTQKNIQIYHNGDMKIIFLNCNNNEFYDFCIENEITIDNCVIAVQLNDNTTDKFLYNKIKNIFKAVKVKKILLDIVNITQEQRELLCIKQIGQVITHKRIAAQPLQLILAELIDL